MAFIQAQMCKKTPPATATEYYFDPKIMLLGTPIYEPEKIQNKVSDFDFVTMRRAMIQVGGGWLTATKIFFVLMIFYCIFCAVFGNVTMIMKLCGKPLDISIAIQLLIMGVPNIIFQVAWLCCMVKSSKIIKKFFEEQNEKIYSFKGINWISYGHLMYIQIKILDSEMLDFEKAGKTSMSGQTGKSEKAKKPSNKDILLKQYMS